MEAGHVSLSLALPLHLTNDKHTTLWLPDDFGSIGRLTYHKMVKGGEVKPLQPGVKEDKIFLPIISRSALHSRITVGVYVHVCVCIYEQSQFYKKKSSNFMEPVLTIIPFLPTAL